MTRLVYTSFLSLSPSLPPPTFVEDGRHEGDEHVEHDDDGEDVIDAEKNGSDPVCGKWDVRREVEVVFHVSGFVTQRIFGHDIHELLLCQVRHAQLFPETDLILNKSSKDRTWSAVPDALLEVIS